MSTFIIIVNFKATGDDDFINKYILTVLFIIPINGNGMKVK